MKTLSIEVKAKEIVTQFCRHSEWEDRYRELIKMGKTLEDYPKDNLLDKYLIQGCQSKAWLYPTYKDGQMILQATSEAILVKGIISLLIKVYSGELPSNVLGHRADFLKEIGITEHLSMNRTNGLSSMIKQIQMYALVYKTLEDQGIQSAQ